MFVSISTTFSRGRGLFQVEVIYTEELSDGIVIKNGDLLIVGTKIDIDIESKRESA
ncbi:hypothetical protein J6TS2_50440 [Heyndrickxia sporothermodurans]|nr:hypothetical protein J6TS2_50440 [Heyndrickxia sporothermodurans]